jgi:hypothetical protein
VMYIMHAGEAPQQPEARLLPTMQEVVQDVEREHGRQKDDRRLDNEGKAKAEEALNVHVHPLTKRICANYDERNTSGFDPLRRKGV